MKKVIFAATAAATLLYAPLAQAATVFDFTFTGKTATFGDIMSVNGTGNATVEGLTGSGTENATKGGLNPIITDINITMNQYQLAFADIGTASLSTKNGNFLNFSFTGQDSIHHVPFQFSTTGPDSFAVTAGVPANSDGYLGNFTVTKEGIGTVPEPATWAMLVLGFGGMGAMLRLARRHKNVTAAAA